MDEKTLINEKEIFQHSDNYLRARQMKDEYERLYKEYAAVVEEHETNLIEAMTNEEITSFKRDGVHFSLVNKNHISPEPERKDELWQQMKQKGYEHLFSINSQTLSGEVKRLMEENNGEIPEWLNGLVKQYEKPSIRIKRK